VARATVLVVEDDASVRTSMCAALTLTGFLPHGADSVESALKALGTEAIDAILLDLRLPDPKGLQRTGLSLLKFIRATPEYTDVPVLIFTGMVLSEAEEEVVRVNRAQLFYKPQPYALLIDRLTQLLDAAAG
jgi:CheY-like chemotaxis protein